MTLFEICPECNGTHRYKQPVTREIVPCWRCEEGYVEHVCNSDDRCPCVAWAMENFGVKT